jgi:GT2 family glycosyltransferase
VRAATGARAFAFARQPAGEQSRAKLPAEPPIGVRVQVPIEVLDLEVTDTLPSFLPTDEPSGPRTLLALVRAHSHPMGSVLLRTGRDGLAAAEVAAVIEARLGSELSAHFQRDSLDPLKRDPDIALARALNPGPPCLEQRARALAAAPIVTVIIATRDRTASLARCLDSVLAVEYPSFEVVVVDNDPVSEATAALIASAYAHRGVRYVRENRRGLAAAHNRGLELAAGSILVFTDDDVVVDTHWLAAIVEAFSATGDVGAVTGLIQPGELRTEAQLLLERHGSFAKGFELTIFDLGAHRPADARFPLAVGRCGSGANMAFDAACLRRLGGFDPALGTGTRAKGGDDLAAFFSVLAGGWRIVYQPAAVVRHFHRDTDAALAGQAYGYGVGLGAYLAQAVSHHPGLASRTALSAARDRARRRHDLGPHPVQPGTSDRFAGWPPQLARLGRRGAVAGPFAYLTSAWQVRDARRPA